MSKKRNKLVGFRRAGVSLRSIKIKGPLNHAVHTAAKEGKHGFVIWCSYARQWLGTLDKPLLNSVLKDRAAHYGFTL